MIRPLRVLVAIPIMTLLFLVGCASPKTPPPADPSKEQIIILQKQLLELQNVQNETRRKVDEQAAVINDLSSRIKNQNDRTAAAPLPPSSVQKHPGKRPAKKRVTKRRPVRRRVQ